MNNNYKVKAYFKRIKESFINLVLDVLGKEKKVNELEWYSYMYYRVEEIIDNLEAINILEEDHTFKVHLDLGYNHLLYECEVSDKLAEIKTIKEYNNLLRGVADSYVDNLVNKKLNIYLENLN